MPNSSHWQSLDEYIYEFDIIFKSGVDRHAYYRVNPSSNFVRVLHFTYPGGYSIFKGDGSVGFSRGYIANVKYHYKVIVTSSNVKVFESSDVNPLLTLVSDVNQISPMPAGFIGLGSSPGSSTTTQTWFDNVRVTTLDHEDEVGLPVPLLKQTDLLWTNDIYDSASLWAPSNPTIGRWGCAITSAAMVLKYHNINKLPDGSALNPSSLNSYLISTPGGYKRTGATNWEKIAAMTKAAKSVNPEFSYDALKYLKGDNDLHKLEADIENNIPNILEVPLGDGQHFVVAKHVDDMDILINDPGFDRDDLSQYGNTFVSSRRFIPTNTDLSYLVFDIDPGVSIYLKDSEGNLISEGELELPIADPLGLISTSGNALKVISIPEPETGIYELVIEGPENYTYTLDQYFYDIDGNVKLKNVSGVLHDGSDLYTINFDKENSDNSDSQIVEEVTFDSIKQKIKDGYKEGKIKFGTQLVLLVQLEVSERARKDKIQKGALNLMILLITKDKRIDDQLAVELIEDIRTLRDSL